MLQEARESSGANWSRQDPDAPPGSQRPERQTAKFSAVRRAPSSSTTRTGMRAAASATTGAGVATGPGMFQSQGIRRVRRKCAQPHRPILRRAIISAAKRTPTNPEAKPAFPEDPVASSPLTGSMHFPTLTAAAHLHRHRLLGVYRPSPAPGREPGHRSSTTGRRLSFATLVAIRETPRFAEAACSSASY